MVVLPYQLVRNIIEPLQGHATFDLKESADIETIDNLNKKLNKLEGEQPPPEPPLQPHPEPPPEAHPVPEAHPDPNVAPAPPPETPKSGTRQKIRAKLLRTGAYVAQRGEIIDWSGKMIEGSHINKVLDYAFGTATGPLPRGSKEIAERLKALGVKELPNKKFTELIVTSPKTRKAASPRTRKTWTKF